MVTLADALRYWELGWSVIPMRMAKKRAAVRWKRFQEQRPDAKQLGEWFNGQHDYGLAVIYGTVSGGLASRDFDDLDSYERWAVEHPDLAKTLPTVETRRGRHVYCRLDSDDVAAFRRLIDKPDGTGAIHCDCGELRIGVGCYSVIPNSQHPSGFVYRWLVSPFDEAIPLLTLADSGFFPDATQRTQTTQRTQAIVGVCGSGRAQSVAVVSSSLDSWTTEERVEAAIAATLPLEQGERNHQVFEFARRLKAIPTLVGADFDQLRPVMRDWHNRAKPRIGTQAFEETWADFIHAWPRVKHPKGTEPMAKIVVAAFASEVPECVRHYESEEMKSLASLCRELQRIAGSSPFYLGTNAIAEYFKVNRSTASRWLAVLMVDRVIELVTKGSLAKKRVSEFRYLGDWPKVVEAKPDDTQQQRSRER